MEINLITVIGISLAAMFFGYFIGLFEGRGQGARKRKAEEAVDNIARGSVEMPLPPPSPRLAPAENRLLAINLDEMNQPQLEMDGQPANASQLTPDQRKRLIELMLILRPWVEGKPVQKQTISPQPTPRPMTASLAPAPPPPAAKQAAPKGAAPVPEPALTSMVSQIDAILQARLIGTPLEDKGIRLVESIGGDALVFVGDKSYPGVGDVPDPAVQAAIRAATAEWERRYTPGYR
jgi:hypothetical protein